ncbi:MAG: hypothetical protein JNL58_14595 [Planctomyces sp.]|nr:hypothetical protein [Planctomyces sp.]
MNHTNFFDYFTLLNDNPWGILSASAFPGKLSESCTDKSLAVSRVYCTNHDDGDELYCHTNDDADHL